MGHHHPAASAEGSPLQMIPSVLRDLDRVGVLRRYRDRVGVAHGEAADLGCGSHVGSQQRRGEPLGSRQVVETAEENVGGKPAPGVHIEVQHIANDALVLGPAEPLEAPNSGIGAAGRSVVDQLFQCLHQHFEGIPGRTRHARRRHHSRAHLADHAFRRLRLLWSALHFEALQRDVARQQRVVVTDLTILHDDLRQGRGLDRTGMGSGRGAHDFGLGSRGGK